MAERRKIVIFSAGCATCQETVDLFRRIAGANHASKFTTCIRHM